MNRLVRMPGRSLAGTALAGLLAAAAIAATPAAASAQTTITVRYPVKGSTFLKAANATVNLGAWSRSPRPSPSSRTGRPPAPST